MATLQIREFKDNEVLIAKFLTQTAVVEFLIVYEIPVNMFKQVLIAFCTNTTLHDVANAVESMHAITAPTTGGMQ